MRLSRAKLENHGYTLTTTAVATSLFDTGDEDDLDLVVVIEPTRPSGNCDRALREALQEAFPRVGQASIDEAAGLAVGRAVAADVLAICCG